MTQQAVLPNSDAAAVRGRPFLPGQSGNPNGRPKKGHAIRDIVRKLPLKDKRAIVEIAVQEVIRNHDVQWATWLLKAEGESGDKSGNVMRELIVREYGFDVEALD